MKYQSEAVELTTHYLFSFHLSWLSTCNLILSPCNFLLYHFPIFSAVAVRSVYVVILVMFVESIRFYYVSDNLSDNGLLGWRGELGW